jgi:hypothetical protein
MPNTNEYNEPGLEAYDEFSDEALKDYLERGIIDESDYNDVMNFRRDKGTREERMIDFRQNEQNMLTPEDSIVYDPFDEDGVIMEDATIYNRQSDVGNRNEMDSSDAYNKMYGQEERFNTIMGGDTVEVEEYEPSIFGEVLNYLKKGELTDEMKDILREKLDGKPPEK